MSSLSNALGWISLHVLCSHWHVALSNQFLLAGEARLPGGTATTRARWTEVHDYCYRHFISHLITASTEASAFILLLWHMMLIPRVISPSADTGAVLYRHDRPGLMRRIVTELEASSIVVYATLVAINLLLRRRALVRHRNIILSNDAGTDRRNVGHARVVVRAAHLGN